MSQLTEIRKSLSVLASHLTPQSHALLVKTAQANRLAPELQEWVNTLSPANVTALLALVDSQDRQIDDMGLHIISTGTVTIEGDVTITGTQAEAISAPQNAPEEAAEETQVESSEVAENAASKPARAKKG